MRPDGKGAVGGRVDRALSFKSFRPPVAKRPPRTQSRLYDFFWFATGRLREVFPGFVQMRMSAQTFALLNMAFIRVPRDLIGRPPLVRALVQKFPSAGREATAADPVPGVVTAPLLVLTGVLVLRELFRADRAAEKP